MQEVSEWLKNAAVTFLWVLCSHLSGEMWWEAAAAAAASASSESTKPTKTLLESSAQQPHTCTRSQCVFLKKQRKEFHLVLTGLISYSVDSDIIHGDQGGNRNCVVVFLSRPSWGNQGENNGKHTTELSHKSCFSSCLFCNVYFCNTQKRRQTEHIMLPC